jgi:6-phosphogluconolactonase
VRERRVLPDLEALSRTVAEHPAEGIRVAVTRRGRCALVLTGGRTPRRTYDLLAGPAGASVPWPQVDVFWGDERYVPLEDPQSNYHLARVALLDHVGIRPENVRPVPTHHADPDVAAREYEQGIREYFGSGAPRFDLVLLGMAANGHVASLFPGQPALHERDRWVVAATVPADPPRRVTMTLPLLNQAEAVLFLVAGKAKAGAVRRALTPGTRVDDVPAAGVVPEHGTLVWWLDAAAAGGLRE